MNKFLLLTGGLICGTSLFAGEIDVTKLPPPSTRTNITFATDIKPLFEQSCIRCHGPGRARAGIKLDTRENVIKGGKDGALFEVGKSDKSTLVVAISMLDPKSAMPPGSRNQKTDAPPANPPAGPKPLTAEEVGLVRAWIDQGAR
jgi:mono/diheme cytochrome c family protein